MLSSSLRCERSISNESNRTLKALSARAVATSRLKRHRILQGTKVIDSDSLLKVNKL